MTIARTTSAGTSRRELKREFRATVIRWDPRHLYKSLLHLFGEQSRSQVKPVVPPFNPPLSRRQFELAQGMYVQKRVNHFLSRYRTGKKVAGHSDHLKDRWPALPMNSQADWEAERALGTLFFASARREQREARKHVKYLAEHGPMRHRGMLKAARQATPQARSGFSAREVLRKYGPRLAEFEFVWGFLRGEANALQGRADRQGRSKAATNLAKYYPFLNLNADQIAEGLSNPKHVERQFAAECGISQNSVRSIFR